MPTPIDNSMIGDYIAKCRKQKGLTQRQLAEELDVTNKAVSKWERGKGLPDITLLPQLARVLGTTADGILSGGLAPEEAPPPETPAQAAVQPPAAPDSTVPPGAEKKPRLLARLAGRRPGGRVVFGGLLLCGATGVFLAQLAFLALRARYQLAYSYGDVMGAWLLAAACLLLFGGLILLLWKRPRARVALTLLCGAALVGCIVYQANVESAYRFTVERSPKGGHRLILRTDTDNGKTMLYRPFFLWYAQPSSQFPYAVDGEVKTQWLAADVCAVTYQSADGKVHQFVATYGRRDNDGVSYLPMTGVLQNTWRAEANTTAGWHLVVGEEGIDVLEGYNKYHYDYGDCVQFGRLAVALCRDGLPEWTIALGDNVLLDSHDRIRYGGDVVLCQVAMGKTAPVTFVAQDGRPEPEDDGAEVARANGRALYDEMRAILKKDPALESTELEGGFWAVRTDSSDLAEVGRLAFAADVRRGEVPGVTFTYQINSMQVLAGDENDFLMDYDIATSYKDNAGSEDVAENGYAPRYRLMRGDGVYLAAWVTLQTDGGYALTAPDMEQVYQVHWDANYRFTFPEGAGEAGAAQGTDLGPQPAARPKTRATALPGRARAPFACRVMAAERQRFFQGAL